jgi:hypothetical protein
MLVNRISITDENGGGPRGATTKASPDKRLGRKRTGPDRSVTALAGAVLFPFTVL